MHKLRTPSLIVAVATLLAGCDQPDGEYVKTVKGDIVRRQDAESAHLSNDSQTSESDSEVDQDQ